MYYCTPLLQGKWRDCSLLPSRLIGVSTDSVYRPLKPYANRACHSRITNHPGQTMTI